MKKDESIRQISFDSAKSEFRPNYIDNSIAIYYDDIKELPIQGSSIRINMFIVVACLSGKLQVELNTTQYTIGQNECLVCRAGDVIENCMMSIDFNGIAICLSQRGLIEHISESDLWTKANGIFNNPVIHVSDESLLMLNHYGKSIREKVKQKDTQYYREIITSIAKAALYELMSNVNENKTSFSGTRLVKQREVLFKKFISLLVEEPIKQRQVSWYADRLCVTPKHMSTVCKLVSGRTAFDWINEYLMVEIRNNLKYSSKNISEIADQLNFSNISSFGKYCRKNFGLSPVKLRERLRTNATT